MCVCVCVCVCACACMLDLCMYEYVHVCFLCLSCFVHMYIRNKVSLRSRVTYDAPSSKWDTDHTVSIV